MKKFLFIIIAVVASFMVGQYWQAHLADQALQDHQALQKEILDDLKISLTLKTERLPLSREDIREQAKLCAKGLTENLSAAQYGFSNPLSFKAEESIFIYVWLKDEQILQIEALPHRIKTNPIYEILLRDFEKKLAAKIEQQLPDKYLYWSNHRAKRSLQKLNERVECLRYSRFYSLDEIAGLKALDQLLPELWSSTPLTKECEVVLDILTQKYASIYQWDDESAKSLFLDAKVSMLNVKQLGGVAQAYQHEYALEMKKDLQYVATAILEQSAEQFWLTAKLSQRAEKYLSDSNIHLLMKSIFDNNSSASHVAELSDALGVTNLCAALRASQRGLDNLIASNEGWTIANGEPLTSRSLFVRHVERHMTEYLESTHTRMASSYARHLWENHYSEITREKLKAIVDDVTRTEQVLPGFVERELHQSHKKNYQRLVKLDSKGQFSEAFKGAFYQTINNKISKKVKPIVEGYVAEIFDQLLAREITIDVAVERLFEHQSNKRLKDKTVAYSPDIFTQMVAVVGIDSMKPTRESQSKIQDMLKPYARLTTEQDLKKIVKLHFFHYLRIETNERFRQSLYIEVAAIASNIYPHDKGKEYNPCQLTTKSSFVANQLADAIDTAKEVHMSVTVQTNPNRTHAMLKDIEITELIKIYRGLKQKYAVFASAYDAEFYLSDNYDARSKKSLFWAVKEMVTARLEKGYG